MATARLKAPRSLVATLWSRDSSSRSLCRLGVRLPTPRRSFSTGIFNPCRLVFPENCVWAGMVWREGICAGRRRRRRSSSRIHFARKRERKFTRRGIRRAGKKMEQSNFLDAVIGRSSCAATASNFPRLRWPRNSIQRWSAPSRWSDPPGLVRNRSWCTANRNPRRLRVCANS